MNHKHPIYKLGDYENYDYETFKEYLRLPYPYLRVVFKNYKVNLSIAVKNLHKIIEGTNNYHWEKMMEDACLKEKLYKVANIPPMYFADKAVSASKADELTQFKKVLKNLDRVKGETFYFYSEFGDAALNAGTKMLKEKILAEKKLEPNGFCVSLPALLADYKTDFDANTITQKRTREEDLVVIYAVGNEHTTEFTTNLFQEILRHRQAFQKTTVICSCLTPRDFMTRYNTPPLGIEMGFVDPKVRKTIDALAKDLGL